MKHASAVIPIVAGIGNALMAVPLVRQLKTRAGIERITVIARIDAMGEPFRRMPEVDEVLITGSGTKNLLRGVSMTRERKPDLFVVPFPSNRWQYSMLAATSAAKRVLIHSYPVGLFRALHFLAGPRLPAERGLHDVMQNLRLLRTLDVDPDYNEAPRFELNEADRAAAGELLGTHAIDGKFIAIHAGSAQTILARAKRWPAENYAALIAALHEEINVPVVLLEGPDEAGVADGILSQLSGDGVKPTVVKLAGNLGIAGALLQRASLYVGSDSGLAHLAAAVGTAPLTLFAPADPDRVAPFGYRDLVVQPPTTCTPCFLYPWTATKPKMQCGTEGRELCIRKIAVEQVIQRMRLALARQ